MLIPGSLRGTRFRGVEGSSRVSHISWGISHIPKGFCSMSGPGKSLLQYDPDTYCLLDTWKLKLKREGKGKSHPHWSFQKPQAMGQTML